MRTSSIIGEVLPTGPVPGGGRSTYASNSSESDSSREQEDRKKIHASVNPLSKNMGVCDISMHCFNIQVLGARHVFFSQVMVFGHSPNMWKG